MSFKTMKYYSNTMLFVKIFNCDICEISYRGDHLYCYVKNLLFFLI